MTIWMQTSSGKPVDLANPSLTRLDLRADIAVPLARIARFSGHSESARDGGGPGAGYSVAQHSVIGADALYDETLSTVVALAFLIHDAHEALIGDITTPAADMIEAALGQVLRRLWGEDAIDVCRKRLGAAPLAIAIKGSKRTLDRQIRRIAGLPASLPEWMELLVDKMDRRMLDAERRQILGEATAAPFDDIWPAAVRQAEPVRLRGTLRAWSASYAASQWLDRFDRWRIPAA